jgi:hypothetical protein
MMPFTAEPGVRYDMPVPFGPSAAPPVSEGFETYTTVISHRTTPEALTALMPHWFEPQGDPVLSVTYTRMVGMEWMGGRNYNIVSIGTPAAYVGPGEREVGRYTLAIWESDCAPVLAGREYMGSPKLHAGIPDVDVFAGDYSFGCTEYGAELVTGTVSDLRELTPDELAPITEAGRHSVGLNWKYVPGFGDEPDVSYPTALYMSTPYERGMRGHGSIAFGTPTDREAPYSGKIARTLAKVPLLEHVDTIAVHSSYSYLFRDRTRRLDVPAGV